MEASVSQGLALLENNRFRLQLHGDLHDPSTATHADRLLHLVTAITRPFGQPEAEKRLIGLAVRLHAIGAFRMPDASLQKPGALDAKE